jgi:flagellar hook assembly protein FlgD
LYKITIYNRIGEIVYSGTNVGWDGRMANGSLAREGTYVYRLEVELESTRKLVKTGNLNVVYLSQ